ncbi:MAG: hypothetical protein IJR52_05860, partial [Selenomonadaceae bacterium]|nr:hypothetical protein [Selenomonadaceae bacterium]
EPFCWLSKRTQSQQRFSRALLAQRAEKIFSSVETYFSFARGEPFCWLSKRTQSQQRFSRALLAQRAEKIFSSVETYFSFAHPKEK